MSRLKALDGLRAVAVLAVLASHTLPRAHGGFLGVDVFFVLSGYLITTLLIKEYESTGRIDFAGFYRRRAARLFPAYLVLIALTIPLMIGPLHGIGDWPWQWVVATSAVYGGNWAQAFSTAHLGPLLHTWSLSVEEQFYLLWPITFLLLIKWRRSMIGWVSGAALVTIAARAAGWALFPGLWPYFATVTHSDGLLLGALVAILMAARSGTARSTEGTEQEARRGLRAQRRQQQQHPRPTGLGALRADRYSELFAWPAAAVLGLAMLVLDLPDAATYYYGLTASAVATAVIVRHLVITSGGPMVRLLSWRPLVALGRISYGLYLYHMPIFLLAQGSHLGFAAVLGLECAGTALVSSLSWYLLERPVQRWAARRWPRRTVSPNPETTPAAKPETGPLPQLIPAALRLAAALPTPDYPAWYTTAPRVPQVSNVGLPGAQALPGFRPELVPAGPAWDFIAVHPAQVIPRPAPVFAVPAWDVRYSAPPHRLTESGRLTESHRDSRVV